MATGVTKSGDMPHSNGHDSLSFGDALFLYLERPGVPLHIASVNVFEGRIARQRLMPFIASRLPRVPRFLRRVAVPPLNFGLPSWEHDADFDLRNHIRQVTLKRGSRAEFQAVVGNILSVTMDRRRPLWDLTLVRGLQGERTGLILRIHHCLADGLAGIGLMNALLDSSPVSAPPAMRRAASAAAVRRAQPELLDDVISACFSAVQQVLTAQSELLALAQRMVAAAGKQPEGVETPAGGNSHRPASLLELWGRMMPEWAAPAERLPFNVVCRGPQKFNWTEIPVADIKAVKQAAGATFNDVALAAIAATVRRYAELHDVRLKNRTLRVVVPVSVRGQGDAGELGNRITFLPVSLPLDIADPRELLAAVCERMAELKSAQLAEFVGLAGTLIGTIPGPVQSLFGPIASQLPLSLCNLIFTNVHGPEGPLYLLGHKMLSCYPYVPIGGEMGMNCALLTYNGAAHFGFTGDANAVPDLRRFEGLLTASFAELRKSAGIQSPRRKAGPAKAKRVAEPVVAPAAPEPAPAPATPEPPPAPRPVAKSAAA